MSDARRGRSVLVTGASSGVGRATALRLAGQGERVALLSREESVLDEVAADCSRLGAADVLVLPTDIGDDEAVAAAIGAVRSRWGSLDVVVNTAGVASYGPTDVVPADVFEGVIRTNLLGSVNIGRHALAAMREQGHGILVLIGSIIGFVAVPQMTAYATSKWGVRSLARQLTLENRDLPDVHVCHVSLGGVDTPIYEQAANYVGPQGRPPFPVYSPGRVARRLTRLIDHPRVRIEIGFLNRPMRLLSAVAPRVSDFVMGLAFPVGATDMTKSVDPTTGNVLAPVRAGEGLHGRGRGPITGTLANLWLVIRGRRAVGRMGERVEERR